MPINKAIECYLNFRNIISVLKNAGKGVIGYGEASGDDATVEATKQAIKYNNQF